MKLNFSNTIMIVFQCFLHLSLAILQVLVYQGVRSETGSPAFLSDKAIHYYARFAHYLPMIGALILIVSLFTIFCIWRHAQHKIAVIIIQSIGALLCCYYYYDYLRQLALGSPATWILTPYFFSLLSIAVFLIAFHMITARYEIRKKSVTRTNYKICKKLKE